MNKTLKKFAFAILATGATVAATSSQALDTNTFTNVIQSVTVNLTVYSNSPFKSTTDETGGKTVTITTKSIIAALSNASSTIPALSGFNFGRSPQLVMNTTFMSTNTPVYLTNGILTNTVVLSSSNMMIAFDTNTVAFPTAPDVTIVDTNGSAIITNNAIGTNSGTILTVTGDWTKSGSAILTNIFSYLGTNGFTNSTGTNGLGAFPTNIGVFTVITANTNTTFGVTNVVAITYTNVPNGTKTNYLTNYSGIAVQGGTSASPVFADVGSYLNEYDGHQAIITMTGNLEITTNRFIATYTAEVTKHANINLFGTTGSAVGDNLSLALYGFGKTMYKYDVLHAARTTGTNQVPETTSTSAISGSGYIGGTYVTNSMGASNSIDLPSEQFTGIGSITNTNTITGSITNPIPVVVEGTLTIGAPHSVPQ